MLIKFKVKNFMSFKEEQVLDLSAISYKNMKEHVLEIPKNKIVKTLAIYGATASGKSNLIKALYYFETFIYRHFYEGNERNDEIAEFFAMNYDTFFGNDEDSEFELELYLNQKIYRYGATISYLEHNIIVHKEWFYVNNKLVFDRKGDSLKFGTKYANSLKDIPELRDDKLYVGVIEFFAKGEVRDLIDDLKVYFERHFNVFFDVAIEARNNFNAHIAKDDLALIKELMVKADLGIVDIEIKERISFIHEAGNEQYKVALENESSGTIRFFIFVKYLVYLIKNGGVLIVDDLTSKLNHNLVKLIIDIFQSSKNTKAGLVFTTNDLYLLGTKQFRKDEIVVVEKTCAVSKITSLASLGLRSDANILSDYVEGKYSNYSYFKTDDLEKIL